MTEDKSDTRTGQIAGWRWAEYWSDEVTAAEIIFDLRRHFTGMRAVCSAWDSGMLRLKGPEWSGWTTVDGYAVSPLIDDRLTDSWPQSSCGHDEWYFFDAVPTLTKIHAFSKWLGMSISTSVQLTGVPSGFDLREQLERINPMFVVGEGDRVFILAKDKQPVSDFLEACQRRRTTRSS